MDQVIFKYANEKFVGIATQKSDGTLNHQGYALVKVVPEKGEWFLDRQVVELLTEEDLGKERSRLALNEIVAVAVLSGKGPKAP